MAKRFLTPINVLNAASDPVSASEGDLYYNTSSDVLKIYSNGSWTSVSGGGGGGVTSITGTTDEIDVSASTGAVTLSLPSTINANTTGTAASLTTARTIALSGDVSGSASFDGSASAGITATLANTAVSASSYGSASAVGTFTVDSKGRLTAAANEPIVIAQSAVTNLTSDLAEKQPLNSSLTSISSIPSTSDGVVTVSPEVAQATVWTTVTSNIDSSYIRSIAYSGSIWVAAGDSSEMRTSTDGNTWTTVTSNFGGTNVRSVAYGNGIWTAVGYYGQIRTSTNAVTWVTQTSNFDTSEIYSIAYSNGIWVAGGHNGNIRRSTDAITWTTATTNIENYIETFSVAYANNVWVAGGDKGTIRQSTDAITWTTVNSNMPDFGSAVFSVAYGNGLWLAAGYLFGDSHIQSSTDLITWTTVTSNFGSNKIRSIAYANDIWVAGGYSGQMRISTNGSTWTTVTSNFVESFMGVIDSVAYGNGIWLAGGYGGNIRMSQESPMSWTVKSVAEITGVNRNVQTDSYSVVLSDAGKTIEMNSSSSNNLTIPLNSSQAFPIGTTIDVIQYGTGQTTIVATGGVTIRSKEGNLKLTGQYSGATLYKRDTDEWVVVGDLTT